MRAWIAGASACAGGYLIGSIPVGVLLGRALRGLDVREHGSGSMGTTNVLRLVGPSAAALTFGLDVAKGSAAVLLARRLGAGRRAEAAAGVAAMVGHCWPALARFRGGKGVATGFGGILLISRRGSLFAVCGGLTALLSTRIVSVGSLAAVGSAFVGAALDEAHDRDGAALLFAGSAAVLITLRHAPNIERLMRGTEPRVALPARNS